jgi:hypothetical protein
MAALESKLATGDKEAVTLGAQQDHNESGYDYHNIRREHGFLLAVLFY